MDYIVSLRNTLESAIINPLLVLLSLAAVIVFIWGVIQFIWGLSSGSEMKDEGKKHLLWGLIGLIIIFSAIGIIDLVTNSLQGTPNYLH